FQFDARWIQEKLNFSVSLIDIERAMSFLTEAGMIVVDEKGKAKSSETFIQAQGEVMRAALIRYHEQMFDLAKGAMEKTPRHLRNINGQTFPIPLSKLEAMKSIMDKALADIAALSSSAPADAVYQFT